MTAGTDLAASEEAAVGADPTFAAGPLSVEVAEGRLRVFWAGAEVVRQIDCPIRDADWRTLAVETTRAEARRGTDGFGYRRTFRTRDGSFTGTLSLEARADAADGTLEVALELTPTRDVVVNRAGFVLLHPIAGTAGAPLEVTHPDGRREATRFPARISPGQPVFDIAGLRHAAGPVTVAIAMEGEVFEMEDQRNWTDASFKTYCRPLGRPRPYRLAAGEAVRQRLTLTLAPRTGAEGTPAAAAETMARMPRIALAHDPAIAPEPAPAAVARLGVEALLLRVTAATPLGALPVAAPVTLEIVTGADAAADIAAVASGCRAAGIAPRRVVALPASYLASHQPEGPWPEGPAPMDLVPLVRAAFPKAEAGGGMLTNFTEFNRCPPDPALIDFATFGTTAIVHAADDRAVIETLEALPQVFESAQALAAGRPLHLGLVAIGMRSNPYGAAVAPNPEGRRLAMAMDDPRQRTGFAAAWAVAAAAAAAHAGVASFAPAMAAGPLGLGRDGALWPIFEAVAALAALGGTDVEITRGGGLVTIRGRGRDGVAGIAANLGPAPVRLVVPAGERLRTGSDVLEPFAIAVFAEAAS